MLLNMVMFKVTICDIGKMNINMTDKIEKRRAANCVYHIGASIKDLGKKWFDFSKMATNSSKSESPHFGAIFRLQEAFSRCINNSFANWLSELVNAEDCIKAFQGICLIQI